MIETPCFEVTDNLEEHCHFSGLAQRRRGLLVHDQNARITGKCLGYLNYLPPAR